MQPIDGHGCRTEGVHLVDHQSAYAAPRQHAAEGSATWLVRAEPERTRGDDHEIDRVVLGDGKLVEAQLARFTTIGLNGSAVVRDVVGGGVGEGRGWWGDTGRRRLRRRWQCLLAPVAPTFGLIRLARGAPLFAVIWPPDPTRPLAAGNKFGPRIRRASARRAHATGQHRGGGRQHRANSTISSCGCSRLGNNIVY